MKIIIEGTHSSKDPLWDWSGARQSPPPKHLSSLAHRWWWIRHSLLIQFRLANGADPILSNLADKTNHLRDAHRRRGPDK